MNFYIRWYVSCISWFGMSWSIEINQAWKVLIFVPDSLSCFNRWWNNYFWKVQNNLNRYRVGQWIRSLLGHQTSKGLDNSPVNVFGLISISLFDIQIQVDILIEIPVVIYYSIPCKLNIKSVGWNCGITILDSPLISVFGFLRAGDSCCRIFTIIFFESICMKKYKKWCTIGKPRKKLLGFVHTHQCYRDPCP